MINRIAAALAFTGALAAQTLVVGTGNPEIDIPAVQSAVNRGGRVLLRGRFSFEAVPAMQISLPGLNAMVVVANGVTISGALDDRGEMPSIYGGAVPIAVEAPGSHVRIERVRFVRPKGYAILVDGAGGLAIESCVIEAVEAAPMGYNATESVYATGIYVASLLGMSSAVRPGAPENITGQISLVNNEITLRPATAENSMGILLWTAGTADNPIDVEISGNTIRNATKKGVKVKHIGGKARIERNTITSGLVYTGHAHGALIAGIDCGGMGTYRIAHNRIEYAEPDGAGIRLRGSSGYDGPMDGAIVVDNDVSMSVADGAVFGAGSAGIEIRGNARNNVVEGNRIRGRARVALSLEADSGGVPRGTTFHANELPAASGSR